MNKIFSDIFKNFDPKQKGFKKKLLSFAFFLFISTAFWFLNALNEKYIETISYPVAYTNLPKDKVQTLKLSKSIMLKVEATGYDLLDYYLSANIKPLLVNFEKDKINKTKTCSYVLSKNILNKTKPKQLKEFNIRELRPDTLKFNFDKIIQKKVPVLVNVKYQLSAGYVLKEKLQAFPDSITIYGTEELISKVLHVNTGMLNMGEIKSTKKRNIAIKKIKNVKFSEYRTNIQIPVEQATENILEIPISFDSETSSKDVKLIPNIVKVSYKVGLSHYKSITTDFIKAYVKLNDKDTNSRVLPVKLDYQPGIIFDVEYKPHFVEYIEEVSHD